MQTKIFGNDILIFNSEDPAVVHSHIRTCFDSKSDFSNEPFLLTNLGSVTSNILKWNMLFPTVSPVFNVQMNNDNMVLKFLNNFGVKFKIMSGNEIGILKECDIDLSSSFYHGPCKINRHIKLAAENGVRYLTFNSTSQLKRMHSLYPNAKFIFSLSMNHFLSVFQDGSKNNASGCNNSLGTADSCKNSDENFPQDKDLQGECIVISGNNLKHNLCYTNSYASDIAKVGQYVDPLVYTNAAVINSLSDAQSYLLSTTGPNSIINSCDAIDENTDFNSDKGSSVCDVSFKIESNRSSDNCTFKNEMGDDSCFEKAIFSQNLFETESKNFENEIKLSADDLKVKRIMDEDIFTRKDVYFDERGHSPSGKRYKMSTSEDELNGPGLFDFVRVMEYAKSIGAVIVGFSIENAVHEYIKNHYINLLQSIKENDHTSCNFGSSDNIVTPSRLEFLESDKIFSRFLEVLSDFLKKSYELKFEINMIDLGETMTSFSNEIEDSLCAYFNSEILYFQSKNKNISVYADSSRFLINGAVDLCCSVVGVKKMPLVEPSRGEDSRMFYYLNDGIYGSLNNIIFDGYLAEPFVLRADESFNNSDFDHESTKSDASFESVFWGPTCDSMDKICTVKKMQLLKIDDVIVFKNVGSYSRCASSNFNGFNIAENKHYMSNAWADVVNGRFFEG